VRALRRLPIRLRLTLAFALAMALVLAATGAFVYLRMRAELDESVDQGLRARAGDVTALLGRAGPGLGEAGSAALAEREESFAQVIGAEGSVLDSTPQLDRSALLSGAELRRALRHTVLAERDHVSGVEGAARLLGTPARARDGQRVAVVVGASLDDRDEALGRLLLLLAIGGPVALLLASLAGYGVAAAALRPVESMRREAEAVSVSEPGRRLPAPSARDEVARLADTLNEMLARQEAAFARERTFVADASHELRTPLGILRTELELALREGRTVEELEAALRSAAEETDRLSRLAEDLLVIARSDQGELPIHAESLAVAELLEGARERYRERSARAGRAIRVEADGAARVVADRLRVEQALANLVENAVRHGAGEVVLSAERRDGAVELHVRDEGPGFPPDFLGSAFERFTRADPGRSRGGAGLGLPIVAAIAAAHGGTAEAANRPRGGADVWIRLPGTGS
jgi:two-component system, OmpR family, sensor kinase